MLKTAVFAAALLCALTVNSHARQRPHISACVETGSTLHPSCMGQQSPFSGAVSIRVTMHKVRHSANPRLPREMASGEVVGSRPAGCPHAYCGCGASLHLFGRIIPSLNLAANWFQFPHAAPAPGMAAVRRHHVMVLETDLGGGIWRVWDANSGHHLTRVHARSISRYQIVDPRGAI